MGNIYLDKDDVIAIAGQREYDVYPPKSKSQYLLENITNILWIVSTGIGIGIVINIRKFDKTSGIFVLAGIVILLINTAIKYLNEEPLRAARREFIEHWEKTGEIKPRWPGRLKKNKQDGGRPYQGA